MLLDGSSELLVLLLEEGDRLLQGLEEELLPDAGPLGVLAVSFPVKGEARGGMVEGEKKKKSKHHFDVLL